MSDHYWLSEAQLERINPYFPQSHGRPRVDDRRVISGIIHIILNSKLHAVTDGEGKPLMLLLSEGDMSVHTGAKLLYPHLPAAETPIADKGYDSDEFRDALAAKDIAMYSAKIKSDCQHQLRQGLLQDARSDRDHVWQA